MAVVRVSCARCCQFASIEIKVSDTLASSNRRSSMGTSVALLH